MKTCPRCAEEVQEDAKACRFCGHDFTGLKRRNRQALVVLAIVVVVGALAIGGLISQRNRSVDHGKRDADDFVACVMAGGTQESCG